MGGVDGVKVAVKDFVERFALVAAVEEEKEGEEDEGGDACGGRVLVRQGRKGKDIPPTTAPAITPALVELRLADPEGRPLGLVVTTVVPMMMVVV